MKEKNEHFLRGKCRSEYVSGDKEDEFGVEPLFIKTRSTRAGECNNWEGTSLLDESIDQAELLVWRLFLLRDLNYLKKKQGIFLFNEQRIWKETIQV